jgi:hypothetical protein
MFEIFILLGILFLVIFFILVIIMDIALYRDIARIYMKNNGEKLGYFSYKNNLRIAFSFPGWKAVFDKEFMGEKFLKSTIIISRITLIVFIVTILLFLISNGFT